MNVRFETLYKKNIRPKLKKELALANIMRVPRITKIVLNTGVKEAVGDSKALGVVQEMFDTIAGQKSVKTRAHQSIAGFKLRQGMAIGVKVTLRGKTMYNFLEKLINLALPNVRDFQGVTATFDGCGNYNLGVRDWMIFPEIDYDVIDKVRGLNISLQTSTNDDKEAYALLKSFNMPFKS